MKTDDILFFYRTDKQQSVIDSLLEKYPHSRFKKITGSEFDLIEYVLSIGNTRFTWAIDLDTKGWDSLIDYNIEKWDSSYLHIFENKKAKLYIVPSELKLDYDLKEIPNKKVIINQDLSFIPYDIFFLSFDENNSSMNLRYLKNKVKDVQVVSGVKGIFNAHLQAAERSKTEFFWVVDADATVIDAFNFDYIPSEWEFDVVHIWKSINPINFLEYGHGGIKLIPKHLILNADIDTAVDITTSIGARIKIIDEISNINNFATSPLSAWRGAFRECAKLASGVIARQKQDETDARLNAWTTKGGDRPLGEYVKGGATAGEWYGKTYKNDKAALAKINDYEWLNMEFEEHVKMFPPEQFKDQVVEIEETIGNTEEIT